MARHKFTSCLYIYSDGCRIRSRGQSFRLLQAPCPVNDSPVKGFFLRRLYIYTKKIYDTRTPSDGPAIKPSFFFLHVSRTKQSGLIECRMMDLLPIPHKDLYGDTVASVLDAFDAKASLDGRCGCHEPSKRQQLPPASLDVHQ